MIFAARLTSKPTREKCRLGGESKSVLLSRILFAPCSKSTYYETEKVVENRYSFRNYPRDNPKYETDSDPWSNRTKASLLHMICSPEDANVEILSCNMAIDYTSDNNLTRRLVWPGRKNWAAVTYGRDGDSIGDFGRDRTGRTERGRFHIFSAIIVDYDCGNRIHGRVCRLE